MVVTYYLSIVVPVKSYEPGTNHLKTWSREFVWVVYLPAKYSLLVGNKIAKQNNYLKCHFKLACQRLVQWWNITTGCLIGRHMTWWMIRTCRLIHCQIMKCHQFHWVLWWCHHIFFQMTTWLPKFNNIHFAEFNNSDAYFYKKISQP